MKKAILIIAGGCLFAIILFCEIIDNTPGPAPGESAAKHPAVLSQRDIAYSARYAVKQYLQSPSSAVFPPWPDNSYRVVDLENNTYVAAGAVTAKNAFGVKLENTWQVRLKFSGRDLDTVNISAVSLNGEIVYNAP